jgi:hypothetical protein
MSNYFKKRFKMVLIKSYKLVNFYRVDGAAIYTRVLGEGRVMYGTCHACVEFLD